MDALAILSMGWVKTPEGTGTQYDVAFEVTPSTAGFEVMESHPES